MKVQKTSTLQISAELLWERLLKPETFLKVTEGWIRVSDEVSWPNKWSPDQTYNFNLLILGSLIKLPYQISIETIDEKEWVIRTREQGGFIKQWRHTMYVKSTSCRTAELTDVIEIQSGFLTPLVWLYGKALFWKRHRTWEQLLKVSNDSKT